MSITQTNPTQDVSDEVRCAQCGSVLPANATFCGSCGERVHKNPQQVRDQQPDTADITERYRVTSLVQRSAFTQMFLAVDTLHQRPVIIRDIDIDSLNDDTKLRAVKAVQHEYDLLRRQHIPDVTPLIDLRYSQEHLFSVGGWPFVLPEEAQDGNSKVSTPTLQDLLQSGLGLPSEQVALTWLYRLSTAIGRLHNLDIVLGNLDPTTIVVSHNTYHGIPALTVSWLPLPIRSLLGTTSSSANRGRFMAPEARLGAVEPRSDIYSLGALLYLLLTGSTPDEPSSSMQRPWHSLREFSPRVAGNIEAIVMRALSVDVSNRFQRVEEMEEALLLAIEQSSETRRVRPTVPAQKKGKRDASTNGQDVVSEPKDVSEEVTISIVSLQSQLARMYLDKMQPGRESLQDEHVALARGVIADTPTISTAHIRDALLQQAIETPLPVEDDEMLPEEEPLPEPMPRATPVPTSGTTGELPLMQRFRERVSGVLPALRHKPTSYPAAAPSSGQSRGDTAGLSLLKRLQRFLLSEQQHSMTAAALIETPLRVQPNQGYAIRIHLTGREVVTPPPGSKKGTQPAGLSAIVHDEIVHIEVRSAIFQNYAYVVQRADVHIPGEGFAAEITIPMQPLSEGTGGRRERLHIFFMDEMRRPLYEKPFAVEVFVSRLVQSGREGHNVLTIPL